MTVIRLHIAQHHPLNAMALSLAIFVLCLPCVCIQADEPTTLKPAVLSPLKSGPKDGAKVQSFFVRAVTGPHRNRSVCYVCRFGSRPVVMVLLQGVDKKVPDLFKALDKVLDAKRATGLRGFGVLVTDNSSKAVPILQTMSFDEKLRIPLTAATSAVAGPSCHNLHENATTTVVFYRGQTTIETMGFRNGELNKDAIKQVLASAEKLLEPR
jgi:hypothetical protein